MKSLLKILSFPFRMLANFFDPLRNIKGLDGEKLIVNKQKPIYILAVRAPREAGGGFYSQRIGTQSYDTLRNFVLNKLRDESIYYIAARRGRRMKDLKAIAVYSERMGGVVCPREMALRRVLKL